MASESEKGEKALFLPAATLARIGAIVIPKRTRLSRPKVRTGCGTCKKKHIKCDERKPKCLRCEVTGAECAGYRTRGSDDGDTKATKKATAKAQAQAARTSQRIRPRINHPPNTESVPTSGVESGESLPPQLSSTNGLFRHGDVPYFDLFRHQLVRDLSGFFYSDFWSRTVLAESMRDDCARHSIIAIGALAQAINKDSGHAPAEEPDLPPIATVSEGPRVYNKHHQTAIRHHTKAVSMFRERIGATKEVVSPRDVMIATLLFVTYELLQGNVLAADSLMNSGIILLKDSIKMLQGSKYNFQDRIQSISRRTSEIDDDMNEIEHLLPRMLVINGFTPFCAQHHGLNAVSLVTNPYVEVPVLGKTRVRSVFQLWSQFCTRTMIFIKNHRAANLTNTPFDMAAAEEEQAEYMRRLYMWRTNMVEFVRHGEEQLLAQGKDTQGDGGKETDDLGDAGDYTEQAVRGLRVLQIHVLLGIVFVAGCLDQTGLAYDPWEPEYREIITRSAASLREPRPVSRIHFTFDVGLAPMLGFVISHCRNFEIRMAAVDVFRQMTWREGAWDSQALLVGKLGLIGLEHSGADENGFVPPTSRYVWTGSAWDTQRRKLNATYYRLVPDEHGHPVKTELLLDL